MMVDVTYQMALSTVQTAGILVGIAYYELNLNYTRKNQEQTLKTRNASVYQNAVDSFTSSHGIKNIRILTERIVNPFSSFEEFSEYRSNNPEYFEAWMRCARNCIK